MSFIYSYYIAPDMSKRFISDNDIKYDESWEGVKRLKVLVNKLQNLHWGFE